MADADGNVSSGAAAPHPRANGRRKRDRSSEAWVMARAAKSKVPRIYPQFVDMGVLSLDHSGVRYSPQHDLYDVRDAVLIAYGNARAVSVTSSKIGKDFGLEQTQFTRARWSDGSNDGPGRVLADAKTCASVLRASTKHHKRPPITVDQTAHWFEEQAGCCTQPTLLDSTVSAFGIANQHPGA